MRLVQWFPTHLAAADLSAAGEGGGDFSGEISGLQHHGSLHGLFDALVGLSGPIIIQSGAPVYDS